MDRTERFYKIQRLLTERKVVSRDVFWKISVCLVQPSSATSSTSVIASGCPLSGIGHRVVTGSTKMIPMRILTSCRGCGSVLKKSTHY